MAFLKRNRLSIAGTASTPQLEARVMLAAGDVQVEGTDQVELRREVTDNEFFADDGFAEIESVGDTGVAAFNNAWNQEDLGDETLRGTASVVDGRARVTVTESPDEVNNNPAPYGFPTLLVGSSNGVTSADNPFGPDGVPQDEIESIPFQFNSNGGENDGVYNNTTDIWFGQENVDGRDVPRSLLMVQNYNSTVANGDTGTGQPAGRLVESDVMIDGTDGRYDVWFGENAGTEAEGGEKVNVTSYIRRDQEGDGLQQTSGNLNSFFEDARSRDQLDPNLPLNNVFAGSEVWGGGEGAYNELELDLVRTQAPGEGGGNNANRSAAAAPNARTAPNAAQPNAAQPAVPAQGPRTASNTPAQDARTASRAAQPAAPAQGPRTASNAPAQDARTASRAAQPAAPAQGPQTASRAAQPTAPATNASSAAEPASPELAQANNTASDGGERTRGERTRGERRARG